MPTDLVAIEGVLWYTAGVDQTNDIFWIVLTVGAFVLGVAWSVINRK